MREPTYKRILYVVLLLIALIFIGIHSASARPTYSKQLIADETYQITTSNRIYIQTSNSDIAKIIAVRFNTFIRMNVARAYDAKEQYFEYTFVYTKKQFSHLNFLL